MFRSRSRGDLRTGSAALLSWPSKFSLRLMRLFARTVRASTAQRCWAAYALHGRQASALAITPAVMGRPSPDRANARRSPISAAGKASGSRRTRMAMYCAVRSLMPRIERSLAIASCNRPLIRDVRAAAGLGNRRDAGGQATEGGDLVDDLYAGLLFILLGERLLDEPVEGRDERAFVEDSDRLAGCAARLRREYGPGGVRRGDLRKSRRDFARPFQAAAWLAAEPDLSPTGCALMASPELNHTIAM